MFASLRSDWRERRASLCLHLLLRCIHDRSLSLSLSLSVCVCVCVCLCVCRRLLDRYSWDEKKVCELYRRSLDRRKALGVDAVKREIEEGKLTVDQLPYAEQVRQVISINGICSLEKSKPLADSPDTECLIDGKTVKYGNVIGCYEMRYGHGKGKPLVDAATAAAAAANPPDDLASLNLKDGGGDGGGDAAGGDAAGGDTPRTAAAAATSSSGNSSWSSWWYGTNNSSSSGGSGGTAEPGSSSDDLTPQQFTRYMVYVTQWRWLQCENYIRMHGELGFWSMIHDCSCPQGYVSLWTRMRSLLGQYMPPVEEACAGLFPPMVQKILIINVPRIFGPAWAVISRLLPQHHKDRIVLLTTSHTSAAEVGKYVPHSHMPTHLKEGRPDGPDEAPPEAFLGA
jgi:hypothetical protein